MNEVPSMYLNLSDQTQYKLNKINTMKDYFTAEIREREAISKMISKFIAALDYFAKTLIVLFATSGGIPIISFSSLIRVPAGIASASFSLVFSLTTAIIKNYCK